MKMALQPFFEKKKNGIVTVVPRVTLLLHSQHSLNTDYYQKNYHRKDLLS